VPAIRENYFLWETFTMPLDHCAFELAFLCHYHSTKGLGLDAHTPPVWEYQPAIAPVLKLVKMTGWNNLSLIHAWRGRSNHVGIFVGTFR